MADDRSIIADKFGNELPPAPPDMLSRLNPAPPAGHNQARPVDLARERVDALVVTGNEWIKLKEITDEGTAERLQTYIRQLDGEHNKSGTGKLDDEEETDKRPHLDRAAAVRDAYRPLKAMIVAAKSVVAPLRVAWLDREQRRLNAEKKKAFDEAERLQREANEAARLARQRLTVENKLAAEQAQIAASKAAAAAMAPPERAQVRDLYGGRAASVRKTWKAEVTDLLQAFITFQDRREVKDVLERLASAQARAGERNIPGFRVYPEETAA